MRYAQEVYFVNAHRSYDPDEGEWTSESTSVKKYANVTHMSTETQRAVFGDVLNSRLTVRLQNRYTASFDYLLIDGVKYKPETKRFPTDSCSFVVIKDE